MLEEKQRVKSGFRRTFEDNNGWNHGMIARYKINEWNVY